ncbi:RIP homotypic interaction motif [Xanthomonas bromi]|uniref:RIP homotypic interaction motif n=1 Tax=Xanthomonas bromi TaxID=56449 RepID=A0A1C3NRX3_9XANT|nr:RIP homotypic interaction motif-containing protein [Xanthomonas bromi]SBV53150.1 RIP homotypic interaction motif [Xanthomonas bromi]
MSILKPNEEARVERRDGQVVGPYKAKFAGSTIIIADQMADVEAGDTVLRRLPNGKDERSVVTEATFFDQGITGIGAHYQVKFRKGGESTAQRPSHNITISGAQSIQIGDYNVQNIANSFDTLVKMIESSNAPPQEKEEAKSLISQLLQHPAVVAIIGGLAGGTVG